MAYNRLFNPATWDDVNSENKELLDDYILELKSNGKSEKTIYHYEDMRVRSLIQLNNLNFLFMLTMSFICLQIEQMDTKLLSITILIESKSLNDDLTVRISQYARGIKAILSHSQFGIRNFRKKTIQNTETLKIEEEIKRDYEQLSFFD